jgi:HD-GYP domain-containing protein (c-di-GMP phosphodiesterase class II)/putative methionine-R-sulfoxide reductase with GAF domain
MPLPPTLTPKRDSFTKADLLKVMEKANVIASKSSLETLLNQMLDLILEVSGTKTGTLYLLDKARNELVFQVVKGDKKSQALTGRRIGIDQGIVGAAVQTLQPILVLDAQNDPRWYRKITFPNLQNVLSIPLLLADEPIGVVQIFNFTKLELELVQLLGNRMASEVRNARLLQASQTRNQRLQALIEIIEKIGSTLDPNEILRIIVQYGQDLLDAEVCALFLVDEDDDSLNLLMSSSPEYESMLVKMRTNQHIIKRVVEQGKTITKNKIAVPATDSFIANSILAVPLRVRTISLGQERGETEERIIGTLEAINNRDGQFTPEDEILLETLARQAATVRQVAQSFANLNELFLDVIQSLTAAIDAKDPYTRGHSQRVSEFSVAIAKQLHLSPEAVHHIRIGAILHDVGKIGVPDGILKKPGRLTDDEFSQIKKHPEMGVKIMENIGMLSKELPALAEHHERLDGSGYPAGLSGDQISIMGRIVAVADVFDAITSDRTYRDALTVEEAFLLLYEGMGVHFDPLCVQALVRAHRTGMIKTQKELETTSKTA